MRSRGPCPRLAAVLAAALVWLALMPPAAALESEADRLWRFAASLMREQEYERAVTEYKRFASYFPDDPRIPACGLAAAAAYARAGHTAKAVAAYNRLVEVYAGSATAEEAAYGAAAASFAGRDYAAAAQALERFPAPAHDPELAGRARLLQAWSLLRLWRTAEARRVLEAVPDDNPHAAAARTLARQIRNAAAVPRKSPRTAGLLSALLPGAGQAYTGRYREALTSFLLNGAFTWASVGLFRHGDEVAGALLGFFETGWYTGGIFGAVNDAHKFNRRARGVFLQGLAVQVPPPRRLPGEPPSGAP